MLQLMTAYLLNCYPHACFPCLQHAVRSLNLGIQRGECFGLLGPNGAGKSTSMSMMVGAAV
jgi:ABC-type multidrug transport system ATPase subunit